MSLARWATLAIVPLMACENPLTNLQQEHIAAHEPSPSEFEALLDRDLTAYFARTQPRAGKLLVTHEFLRLGPTQSGVSYPKYYLWVWATIDGSAWKEGAVRVAAADRAGFTVTDFLTREELAANRSAAERVFPKPVVERIFEHLPR